MNKQYLITEVENYSKQKKISPAEIYKELGILYQSTYGVNIVMEMEYKNLHDITQYLEDKGQGFIDRYIILLNVLKTNN